MKKYYELGPFTIFDVETTGMSAVNDRIVEIAALRVDLNGDISRFQTLVNPDRHIPSGVSRVHHIFDDMVMDAPHFRQVGYDFLKFAKNSTLVAHNARFDLAFLLNAAVCEQAKRAALLRIGKESSLYEKQYKN